MDLGGIDKISHLAVEAAKVRSTAVHGPPLASPSLPHSAICYSSLTKPTALIGWFTYTPWTEIPCPSTRVN